MYYLEEPTPHWPSAALHTVKHISDNMPPGDILLFVPTVKYVEQLCVLLNEELGDKLQALPLYAEIAEDQQQKAMSRNTGPLRKCVVSTNVAETSLNIKGIIYVVDTGIETASGYNPRGNMETLTSSDISKDSARQRAGRARTCFRLYTKKTHDEDFVPITPAEIQSSSITQEVLQVMAMDSNATKFNFVIPPDTEVFFRALTDLTSLWIREYIVKSTGAITPKGRNAARLLAHPMWWNVIIEGEKLGCGSDVTTLAAIASFSCPISDHAAQLNALHAYARTQFQGVIDMDQWCFDAFINRKVMEEIIDVRKQLVYMVESLLGKKLSIGLFDDQYETNIGKALARGLPHKIAIHKSDDMYVTINDNVPVMLSADSGMVGMKHKWVVFNDIIYVGSCYLGTATAVKSEWFADLPFFQDDRLAIRGDGTPRQPQVKEALQSINSPSSLFPSSMASSTPDSSAPLSTSDAARAFLASRKLSAFPQSWRFNIEDPNTAPAAYTSYRNDLFDAYTEAGVLSRGFVKDLDGKQVLRSTSLPSPAPKNNALVRPWSWVQKDDSSARVFQKVALESIPLYEAVG
ncbi:Ff.00g121580.m01.CDS01 [Fusarium sp. VM40]|nr:Ff.00g121580.m01.CDS01 [Fusarium sp. VM40]